MRFNPQTEHLMLSEATLSSDSELARKQRKLLHEDTCGERFT